MRPLAVDVVTFLVPLLVGVGLFVLGRWFRGWPRWVRVAVVTFALGVIGVAILATQRMLPFALEQWISGISGMITIVCLVALFLLGVVWAVPGRSMSSPFLAAISLIALSMIAVEAGGRLWWRFAPEETWSRTADENGLLRQSSGMTCSPAAAVMLLHQRGITAGEGEMAYLAATSMFGTDSHGITRALEAKAGPLGWRVVTGRSTYDEAIRDGGPFLAHLEGSRVGHAVTVVWVTPEGVGLLDPADGKLWALGRDVFESEWDGTTVRLVR